MEPQPENHPVRRFPLVTGGAKRYTGPPAARSFAKAASMFSVNTIAEEPEEKPEEKPEDDTAPGEVPPTTPTAINGTRRRKNRNTLQADPHSSGTTLLPLVDAGTGREIEGFPRNLDQLYDELLLDDKQIRRIAGQVGMVFEEADSGIQLRQRLRNNYWT